MMGNLNKSVIRFILVFTNLSLIVLFCLVPPTPVFADDGSNDIPGPIPLVTEIEVSLKNLDDIKIPVVYYNEFEKELILGNTTTEVVVGGVQHNEEFYPITASKCSATSFPNGDDSGSQGIIGVCLYLSSISSIQNLVQNVQIDITDNDTSNDAITLKINLTPEDESEIEVIEKFVVIQEVAFADKQFPVKVSISSGKYKALIEKLKSIVGDVKEEHIGWLDPEEEIGSVYIAECLPENIALQDDLQAKGEQEYVCLNIKNINFPGIYNNQFDLFGDAENTNDDVDLTVHLKEDAKPLLQAIDIVALRNPFSGTVSGLDNIEIEYLVNPNTEKTIAFFPADSSFVLAGDRASTEDTTSEVRLIECEKENSACVEVSGISAPGDYEFKVDPTNNANADDAVTLKVQVKDRLWVALAFLLIGGALSFAVKYVSQTLLPHRDLMQKYRNIKTDIEYTNDCLCISDVDSSSEITFYARGKGWPAETNEACIQLRNYSENPSVLLDEHEFPCSKDPWWVSFTLPVALKNDQNYQIKAGTLKNSQIANPIFRIPIFIPCPKFKDEGKDGVKEWIKEPNLEDPGCLFVIGMERGSFRLSGTAHFASFRVAMKKYRNHLMWDKSSDEYKGLEKIIDDANTDLSLYKGKFTRKCAEIEKQFKSFEKFVIADPLGIGNKLPDNLIQAVEEKLKGTDIPIGNVQKRIDVWDELISLMKIWEEMGKEIKRYRVWVAVLDFLINLVPNDENESDKKALSRVKYLIREISHEMLTIAKVSELDGLRTKIELKTAYRITARLGAKYDYWQAPLADDEVEKDVDRLIDKYLDDYKAAVAEFERIALMSSMLTKFSEPQIGAYLNLWSTSPTSSFEEFIRPSEIPFSGSVHDYKKELEVRFNQNLDSLNDLKLKFVSKPDPFDLPVEHWIKSALYLNTFYLVFTFIVAAFGSLELHYFDQAWGTGQDYLEMVLTFGGIDLATTGILAGISRMFSQFRR
jgi:hypothetical protein